MFREAIEFTLQFVGVHRMDAGCTSSALGDYLKHDVLPFMGWSSSSTLRDSVVRVAIQESYTHSLLVYAAPEELRTDPSLGETVSASPFAAKAPTEAKRAARRRRPRLSKSDGDDTADVAAAAASQGRALVLLSLENVLKLLDEDRVLWQASSATPSAAASTSGLTRSSSDVASPSRTKSTTAQGRVRLYLCPTQALRERVLNVSLHTETIRTACDFLSDVALHGYDLVHAQRGPTRFGNYKPHLVGTGIRALIRQQQATRCYLYDTSTHKTYYRVFPQYALPLTQREKKALPCGTSGSFSGHHASHNDTNGGDSGDDDARGESDAKGHRGDRSQRDADETSMFPWMALQRQSARACRPLNTYFERHRRLSGCFPTITFDLTLVKYIVQTSPEGRLLLGDALRAVLTAHGIPEHNRHVSRDVMARRREDDRLRRMLTWAGLRVAEAFVISRGKRRRVRLVLTADDLRQRLEAQRARELRRQYRRHVKRSRTATDGTKEEDERTDFKEEDEDDEHELTVFDLSAAADADADGMDGVDDATARSSNSSTSSRASSDAASSDDDRSEVETAKKAGGGRRKKLTSSATRGGAVAASGAALQRRLESADHIFHVSPDWPLELQAVREAERGPLVGTRILPRMQFDGSYRARARVLTNYMTQYVEYRHTLTTHAIITPRSGKTFTTVYEPLPTHQQDMSHSSDAAAHADDLAEPEEGRTPLTNANSSTSVKPEPTDVEVGGAPVSATSLPPPEATPPSLSSSASPSGTRPLPRGVSQYAVDLVLAALNEAPHKALPLTTLSAAVDAKALRTRILPYLRETNRVYTTGVTSSVRKRVGIVALCTDGPPLDEATKLVIVEGDASGKRQPRQTLLDRFLKPPSSDAREPTNGAGVVCTDMVLPAVPTMVDGLAPSGWSLKLAQCTSRATRYADTLMRTRNGYTHYSDARAGRLHLELWRQWWERVQTEDAASPRASLRTEAVTQLDARTNFTFAIPAILENMSLSTYCIVFGISALDLVSLLKCTTIRWHTRADDDGRDDTDDDEGVGSPGESGVASTPPVSWNTPLHALPLEVREWCGMEAARGGSHGSRGLSPALQTALLEHLKPLEQFGLIRLTTDACLRPTAGEHDASEAGDAGPGHTCVELSTAGSTRKSYQFHFYQPHYTRNSTLVAVLRCWSHRWQQLHTSSESDHRQVWKADPNMSFPAVVALQKYLRVSLTTIGRTLYQQAGFENVGNHSGRSAEMKRWWRSQREHAHRARHAQRPGVGVGGTRARLTAAASAHSDTRRTVPRRRGMRIDLDVVDVSESISRSFESGVPQRRLAELSGTLERSWRTMLRSHPLHVLPAPPVTRFARGRSSGGLDSGTPELLNSEYALRAAGHDAATYNPMLRQSALHLGTLGRALNAARETRPRPAWWTNAKPARIRDQQEAAAQTDLAQLVIGEPARTITALQQSVRTVLSPDLSTQSPIINEDGEKTQVTDDAKASQIADRLAAIGQFFAPQMTSTFLPSASSPTVAAVTAGAHSVQSATSGAAAPQEVGEVQGEVLSCEEVAQDVLRMILLSDKAHYSVSIARTLLLRLPKASVARARALLQQCPAFRVKSTQRSRVPHLELAAQASFFPAAANTLVAHPCANVSLMHAVAAQVDADARQAATRPGWSRSLLHVHTSSPAAVFEVELRIQSTIDLERMGETDMTQRADLQLPALSWPREAAALELERARSRNQSRREAADVDGDGDGESTPRSTAHRHHRLPPRRPWRAKPLPLPSASPAAANTTPTTDHDDNVNVSGAKMEKTLDDRDEDDEEVDEDEEADGRSAYESRMVEQQLYPARRLGVGVEALSRIPAAPAPTPAEQQAVLATIDAFERLSKDATASALSGVRLRLGAADRDVRGCGIAYPSIFHHVDGAFHPFVWETFLTSLYRYVQCVPGILHEDLVARLMASGLVRRGVAETGIDHLVLSGVLQRTTVLKETCCSPMRPHAADTDLRERGGEWTYSYGVTAPSAGMWDITQLDKAPPDQATRPL